MKYGIIKVINGNFNIHAEGFTTPESAKVSFHGVCQALWNDPDTLTACVMIVDENFNLLPGGYKESINKV